MEFVCVYTNIVLLFLFVKLQSSSREVRVEGQLRMSETATCVLDTTFPPAQGRYSYHVEMYAQSHLPASFVGTDEVCKWCVCVD